MIKISSQKNKYTYNVYHLVKAFFPQEEIVQRSIEPGASCEIQCRWRLFFLCPQGRKEENVIRSVYRHLSEMTGRELAWGMLTGVRPTKLAMQAIEAGNTQDEAVRYLKETYFISEKKARLGVSGDRKKRERIAKKTRYEKGLQSLCRDSFLPKYLFLLFF